MNKAGNWDKRGQFMLIWILLNGVWHSCNPETMCRAVWCRHRTGIGMLLRLRPIADDWERWDAQFWFPFGDPTRPILETDERTHFAGHCASNVGGRAGGERAWRWAFAIGHITFGRAHPPIILLFVHINKHIQEYTKTRWVRLAQAQAPT